MKKIIFLIWVLLIFVSCGNGSVTDSETSSIPREEELDTAVKDSLPAGLNFGGQTLNLFTFAAGNSDFYAKEETGDLINDEKYRSYTKIEERLNMKLNFIRDDSEWNENGPITKIRASVLAGDHTYDLINTWNTKLSSLSVEGLFMNMYDVPYVNFSEPWWNKSILKELTVKEKLYVAAGDANYNIYGNTNSVFLNKKFMRDYEIPNLYDVVFEGKWTLDYMSELIRSLYVDLNGDGVADFDDQYGIIHITYNSSIMMMSSTNAHLIKIVDDYPRLDPDHEKLTTLVEKVYNQFYINPGTYLLDQGNTPYHTWHIDKLKNGETLLLPTNISNSNFLRDMDDDFGIIPFPKFDEREDQYYSYVYYIAAVLVIPVNCNKTELVGAFMEASACDAYNYLIPLYFDTVMNVKILRDEETSEMIKIIRNSAYFSFEAVFNDMLAGAGNMIYDLMINNKSTDYASWYARNEKSIEGALNNLIDQFEANG